MHVRRNDSHSRYELLDGDKLVGLADFDLNGDTMVFPHTEIDPSMRGRGLGEVLVRGALDDARSRGMRVVPACWFVRDFIRDNPDYAELKAS